MNLKANALEIKILVFLPHVSFVKQMENLPNIQLP